MTLNGAVACMFALLCCFAGTATAQTNNVDGAWASDPDACSKIFVKTRDRITFAKNADLHGSGFVIAGKSIRGKMANCTIKVRKDDGDMVNMAATCSTDVAVETVQFVLKVLEPDRISRIFHGIPELATPYHRCRL
jgi:hypothetical protein